MHICSIITSFTSGGAETLVCNLSRKFGGGGHKGAVVALCDAATLGNSTEVEDGLIKGLRESGVVVASLQLNRKRSLLKGRRSLAQCLHSQHPDLIHAHTARAALMAGWSGSNRPLILTHHNSRLSFP